MRHLRAPCISVPAKGLPSLIESNEIKWNAYWVKLMLGLVEDGDVSYCKVFGEGMNTGCRSLQMRQKPLSDRKVD